MSRVTINFSHFSPLTRILLNLQRLKLVVFYPLLWYNIQRYGYLLLTTNSLNMKPLTQAQRKKAIGGVVADQYFIQPRVAKILVEKFKKLSICRRVNHIIDPCAGDGYMTQLFSKIKNIKNIKSIEAYDLHPQHSWIKQQDFLKSNHKMNPGTLVAMNVPYGTNNALAVKFFNKAAVFADIIVCVVPATFNRSTIQNRLSLTHKLIFQDKLPFNSFYLPGEGLERRPYNVPSIFQVWIRSPKLRKKVKFKRKSKNFDFVKNVKSADFAFRYKGRRAGDIFSTNQIAPAPTLYNIKAKTPGVRKAFKRVDWSKFGHDMVGSRGITQAEIVAAVDKMMLKY